MSSDPSQNPSRPEKSRSQAKLPKLTGQKSALTRAHILDTTIKRLAYHGWAGAGNAAIAEAAQLTRGNLLYHFPERMALLKEVAAQLQAQRLESLKHEAQDLPPKADPIDWAIDAYWRLLHTEPFMAFRALEAQARHDEALALMIWPHQDGFDQAFLGQTSASLWAAGRETRFQAGRDLARFCLEGLFDGHMTFEAGERGDQLKSLLKRTLHLLNLKSPQKPLWED